MAAQALLLAATITAIALALEAGFANFSWPNWKDGARRLERDSGFAHRPISEWHDRSISQDPFALALWRVHQARRIAFDKLRVRWPAPDLMSATQISALWRVRAGGGGLALAGMQWRER